MEEAQESANAEEKSSAGDKYETGRAMSQNQRDLNARQMLEARAALQLLDQNDRSGPFVKAFPGALLRTQERYYFLGPGLGKLPLTSGPEVISLSVGAPLGQLLLGKKEGDVVEFQGRRIPILEIG
jgi:hypothetical protein